MNQEELEKIRETERETEKGQTSHLFLRLIKVGTALMLILGMVYFSGLREYFFFRKTPTDVTVREVEQVLQVENRELPIRIFIIREPTLGSRREKDNIFSMIDNSSKILSQAGIDLKIGEVKSVEINRKKVSELIQGNFNSIKKEKGKVNLILVKTLGELNGLAYPGRNVIIIPDYLAGRDYRTLTHEIGHLLGLGHKDDSRYAMSQGSSGILFSEDEVIKMRKKLDERF